jgi:hypothetical protein
MISKPKSISICFIGGDLSITKNQEISLFNLKNSYFVEFLHRGHKWENSYLSFSQIVNEFLVESKNEFIVFINPKVNPTPEQVEDLIQKLCSGFCWASRINFGFWASTKELFRNIGLMDERFIGGEYEDNDLIIRLKEFGKAIYWEYKLDEYPSSLTFPYSGDRGISKSIFSEKWIELDDEIRIDKNVKEKQFPLSIKLDRRVDIYNSWLDIDKSEFINPFDFSGLNQFKKNIVRVDCEYDVIYSKCNIKLKCENSSIFIEFICGEHTAISVCLINSHDQRLCSGPKSIMSNTWNHSPIFDYTEEFIEIKIFHCGNKIYHNKFIQIPFDIDLNFGLKIKKRIE